MKKSFEVDGTIAVDVSFHEGRGKWIVEWIFNNAGGCIGEYDTEQEAMGIVELFSRGGLRDAV